MENPLSLFSSHLNISRDNLRRQVYPLKTKTGTLKCKDANAAKMSLESESALFQYLLGLSLPTY